VLGQTTALARWRRRSVLNRSPLLRARLLITEFIKEVSPLWPNPSHVQDYDRSMLYPAQPGSVQTGRRGEIVNHVRGGAAAGLRVNLKDRTLESETIWMRYE